MAPVNNNSQDLRHMSPSLLRKWLQEHDVPLPKIQSKEQLQSVALRTQAKLDAEALEEDRQRATKKRSGQKREASTYSAHRRKSAAKSSGTRNNSSVATRSRASPTVLNESSANIPRPANDLHEKPSTPKGSSATTARHVAKPLSANHASLDDDDDSDSSEDSSEDDIMPASSSAKQMKGKRINHNRDDEDAVHQKMSDDDDEDDDDDDDDEDAAIEKKIGKSKKENEKKRPLRQTHSHHQSADGQSQNAIASRIQRLKRSGDAVISHVNERFIKRLKMAPSLAGLHLGIRRRRMANPRRASLILAVCAIIGVASYLYHLKKLEEERARSRRWGWW